MSIYTPDSWVILKITLDDEIVYKVLGGWSGGYLYGDSWRLNSGIADINVIDDGYEFVGYSGSTYSCRKVGEGMRMSMGPGLSRIEAAAERGGYDVEIITMDEYLEQAHR